MRVDALRVLEQLVVAAHFRNLATFHDDDAVGLTHRRQPVRDDQHGAPWQMRRMLSWMIFSDS